MNKKGFTLIELLVVVLIIGILAAIALPQYFKAVEKSRSTEALSIMGSLAAAMERARLVSTDNSYPNNLSTLDIDFSDASGARVSGGTWNTRNFSFSLTGGNETAGQVSAQRLGTMGNYTITRKYLSGKVCCTGNDSICASLGLPTSC
jgi:prepilin-type N-terminal cleavage/methylation domain-containing protein